MRTITLLILAALIALAAPAIAEKPMPTAPAHPPTVKYTKRVVSDATVVDLCDLTGARECIVWNQTDKPLAVKYVTTSAVCTDVVITTGSDTDIIVIPAGDSWTAILGRTGRHDHTLCGKLTAALGGGVAYSAEAS